MDFKLLKDIEFIDKIEHREDIYETSKPARVLEDNNIINSSKSIYYTVKFFSNGNLICKSHIIQFENNSYCIQDFIVKEDFRNEGFGKVIFESLSRIVKNKDNNVFIKVVNPAMRNIVLSNNYKTLESVDDWYYL